jgi:hypothetical protein
MVKIIIDKIKIRQISELIDLLEVMEIDYKIQMRSHKTLYEVIKENQELKEKLKQLQI